MRMIVHSVTIFAILFVVPHIYCRSASNKDNGTGFANFGTTENNGDATGRIHGTTGSIPYGTDSNFDFFKIVAIILLFVIAIGLIITSLSMKEEPIEEVSQDNDLPV